jgi:hypothetical protein
MLNCTGRGNHCFVGTRLPIYMLVEVTLMKAMLLALLVERDHIGITASAYGCNVSLYAYNIMRSTHGSVLTD